MGRSCIVPNCRTGCKSNRSKHSVFHVPRDTELLKKWENAIPGNVKLRPTHLVCDKHFQKENVLREWIKHDSNGQIIARASYKYPHLSKGAVPTIFNEGAEQRTAVESILTGSGEGNFEMTTSSLSNNEAAVSPMECAEPNAVGKIDSSAEYVAPLIEESIKVEYTSSDHSPDMEDSQMDLSVDVTKVTEIDLTLPRVNKKLHSIVSAVTISQQIQEANESVATCQQYSAAIPSAWGVSEIYAEKGQRILFSYAVTKLENGVRVPVTQKCVTLETDSTLEYFVYGRRVEKQRTMLNQTLKDAASLPNTLQVFQRAGTCNGSGVDDRNLSIEDAVLDNIHRWRHKDCTLISNRKRCNFCTRLRNRVYQRTLSMKTRPSLKRIDRKASNPLDQRKISVLLDRNAHERRKTLEAEARVNALTRELLEQKDKMSCIESAAFEKSCAEMQVPQAQKLALKEIMAAASTKDVKGRRYTQEWMMLCMLMNMRSTAFYEFLRKNNVLPLPCTRTIRRYFSLIDLKCGFDEQFGELLKK